MKIKTILIPTLFLFFIASCTPKQKETNQSPAEPQLQKQQQKDTMSETTANQPEVSVETNPSEQATAAVVLNPPHGQPGHICEIPVGSPLPSSPAKAAIEVKKPEPTQPAATAQRLNPPHGQPGHRCEIPVGAPLDSPAQTTAPAANSGSFTPTVENAARLKTGQR